MTNNNSCISAVIITYNEERNIRRCIESIVNIVDEIIVIDSNSSDSTEVIVNCFPKTVFIKQEWLGYSGQKNFGHSIAKYDGILSIDADEELSAPLQKSLLDIKSVLVSTNNDTVFSMDLLNNYCGKWIHYCGGYPDTKIRLFNKQFAKGKGELHEELDFATSVRYKHLSGVLNHYSYSSVTEHYLKSKKYSEISAEFLFKAGKKSSWFKIWFNSKGTFFRKFILQRGFMDGYYGYIICRISAFSNFYKYVCLKEKNDSV